MAYTIAYTDQANKGTITIEDSTINTETSLQFPGRNTTAYGSSVATNFLHLLENFANNVEPDRPVEGQLWYDSSLGNEQLKVYDGTNWVAAGGIKKAANEPDTVDSQVGDLWVDTDNQQLYLFSGAQWILVGPQFSDGLSTGAAPVNIIATDNLTYTAIQIDVAAQPVAIIATETFTPKTTIPGFTTINPGINLSSRDINGDGAPKFYGTAEKAETLIVGGVTVAAGQFMRKDATNTALFPINVQNNQGINYGVNGELNIGVEGQAGIIQHNIEGSNIDLRVRNSGVTSTVVRVDSSLRVGINNEAPDEALDVTGNIQSSGQILVNDTTQSNTIGTGSLIAKGGIGIAKNAYIGGDLNVAGTIVSRNMQPDSNNLRDIGSSANKYRNMYSTTFVGNLVGNVSGTVSGRAGSADKLTSSSTFRLTGDVTAPEFVFDGQTGGSVKTFNTTISNAIISTKTSVGSGQADDEILINRTSGSTGLYKISRTNLLSAVPTNPPGVILPYAGTTAPSGWFLCDGTEYDISLYGLLYDVIGTTYGVSSDPATKFKVPDMRGRMPLGADNMGGSSANRVTAAAADAIGAGSGIEKANIDISNLPDHEHDMKGDANNQFYAIRDVSGTPTDTGAIVFDAPTSTLNGQALPSSGGISTAGSLGQALDIMNPYLTLNYIIYHGGT